MSVSKKIKLDLSSVACEGNSSGTEFMDMNDYCLLRIFKSLQPHGLNVIASTCIRLQGLARASFKSNDANKPIDLTMMAKIHLPQPQMYIENFLRNFGDLIKHIDWNMDPLLIEWHSEMFNLLKTYCGDGSLEKLRLNGSTLNASEIKDATELFCNLKAIHLNRSQNGNQMIAMSTNFVEIVVHPTSLQSITAILGRSCCFPHLEKLSLSTKCVDGNNEIDSFLEQHPRLKYLKLKFDRRERDTNSFNLAALRHCKQLEYIELDGYGFKFIGMPMGTKIDLATLKYLKITDTSGGERVEQFLNEAAASPSLERLAISMAYLVKSNVLKAARANTFRSLQKLVIFDDDGSINAAHLIDLTNLQNLIKFDLLHLRSEYLPYLKHLGSTDTLTELTLIYGSIDVAAIEGMCRFVNLRILRLIDMELSKNVDAIFDVHWAMLKRIDKLTTFECIPSLFPSCSQFLTKFLQNLGSIKSLECFTLDHFDSIDRNFGRALKRFPNLRILKMQVRQSASQVNIWLNIINLLKELEQLKLFCSCITYEHLIDLIKKLPRLRIIKGMGDINLAQYNELIEVSRRQNRKLSIECIGSLRKLSVNLIEENRHIVDIYYKKVDLFNEFKC